MAEREGREALRGRLTTIAADAARSAYSDDPEALSTSLTRVANDLVRLRRDDLKAHDAEVRAEALREAADAASKLRSTPDGSVGEVAAWTNWLHARAESGSFPLSGVRAEAWDEGYETGRDDELFEQRGLSSDSDAHEYPHGNPYRADNIGGWQ